MVELPADEFTSNVGDASFSAGNHMLPYGVQTNISMRNGNDNSSSRKFFISVAEYSSHTLG